MDDIWGNRFATLRKQKRDSKDDLDDDDETPKPKAKAAKPSANASSSPSGASACAASSTPKTEPKADPSPAKPKAADSVAAPSLRQINAHLDKADLVLLGCSQLESNLGSNQTIAGVTAKAVQQLIVRVRAALTAEAVKSYTADYTGQGTTRGITTLDKLRKRESDLIMITDLVAAISTPPKTAPGAAQAAPVAARPLKGIIDGVTAQNPSFKLAPIAYEMIVIRAVGEALTSRSWEDLKVGEEP